MGFFCRVHCFPAQNTNDPSRLENSMKLFAIIELLDLILTDIKLFLFLYVPETWNFLRIPLQLLIYMVRACKLKKRGKSFPLFLLILLFGILQSNEKYLQEEI